ncbi:MAG TPA: DUF5677 domain-containing protein [Candidatus Acidoferrum sp.]
MPVADRAFNDVRSFGMQIYNTPAKSVWFQNILTCLLDANLREYDNLRVGMDKDSTLLVAWGCRNMLELNVFTKYVLQCSANAKNFADDVWIDAIDVFSSFREWLRFHSPTGQAPGLEQTIDNLKSQKSGMGIARNTYLRVNEIAVAVNFEEEYKRMYKATSKLVHPTAFSVLGNPDERQHLGAELRQNFFLTGIRYGLDAFTEMRDYVAKHGVEPLP